MEQKSILFSKSLYQLNFSPFFFLEQAEQNSTSLEQALQSKGESSYGKML